MWAIRFLYHKTYINKRGLSSLIPAEEAIPHSYVHSFITSLWVIVTLFLKSDALHASPNQAWQNGSQKGVVQICCDNGQTWLWPAVQLGSLSVLGSCLSLHTVIWPLANLTWMSYFVHLHQYFCSLQHVHLPWDGFKQTAWFLTFGTVQLSHSSAFTLQKWSQHLWVSLNPPVIFLMMQ